MAISASIIVFIVVLVLMPFWLVWHWEKLFGEYLEQIEAVLSPTPREVSRPTKKRGFYVYFYLILHSLIAWPIDTILTNRAALRAGWRTHKSRPWFPAAKLGAEEPRRLVGAESELTLAVAEPRCHWSG
jgi:hypothetical protein